MFILYIRLLNTFDYIELQYEYRKDVEGKINVNKTKIEALIKKLKMLPNE